MTNRPYSGCNVVLLWMAANAGYRTPRYLTFKQALELGGNVRICAAWPLPSLLKSQL